MKYFVTAMLGIMLLVTSSLLAQPERPDRSKQPAYDRIESWKKVPHARIVKIKRRSVDKIYCEVQQTFGSNAWV